MGNNGMNANRPGQTKSGGDCMEQQEITLGNVIYEVSRIYAGNCPASELIADRLAKHLAENPSFDEPHGKVV